MTFQLVAYQLLDENISPDIAKVFGFLKIAIFHIFLWIIWLFTIYRSLLSQLNLQI